MANVVVISGDTGLDVSPDVAVGRGLELNSFSDMGVVSSVSVAWLLNGQVVSVET